MRPLLLIVTALFSLQFLSACSPIVAECAKAAECNELGNQSQDQCTANWRKKQEDTEANKECDIVVENTLALFDCQSGLSCEERKDVSKSVCASANSDFVGAAFSRPQCLFQ